MKILPNVIWIIDDDLDFNGFYSPDTKEMLLVIGEVTEWKKMFRVLLHECFHWITDLLIPDMDLWEIINSRWDKYKLI